MKATLVTHLELTLTLTPEEAQWLHGYVQNDITGQESSESLRMRTHFFEATKPPKGGDSWMRQADWRGDLCGVPHEH